MEDLEDGLAEILKCLHETLLPDLINVVSSYLVTKCRCFHKSVSSRMPENLA